MERVAEGSGLDGEGVSPPGGFLFCGHRRDPQFFISLLHLRATLWMLIILPTPHYTIVRITHYDEKFQTYPREFFTFFISSG